MGQFLPALPQFASSHSAMLFQVLILPYGGTVTLKFSDHVELVAEDHERQTTTLFINGELQILPFVLSERVVFGEVN